jgi:predicted nucleic acid-binding protein
LLTDQPAVLDTCVLINLLATDRVPEIVEALAPCRLVCSAVAGESLYLRSMDADHKPEFVDLTLQFDEGTFTKCGIEGEREEALYVGYALELDDGEAMSLAIAQSRNFALATDERKARRVIQENAAGLQVISTTAIIHAWANGRNRPEIVSVIRLINRRARFQPPDSDPLAPWWNSLLAE